MPAYLVRRFQRLALHPCCLYLFFVFLFRQDCCHLYGYRLPSTQHDPCVICRSIWFLLSGVQIADVAEDSATALCEDSCTFADDGQCDEPGVVSGRDVIKRELRSVDVTDRFVRIFERLDTIAWCALLRGTIVKRTSSCY